MERNASAVVLVLDRLGAGYLGPYGNTWIDTPAVNRLASQSILIEHPLIDTPLLEQLYRSYWRGLHAVCPESDSGPPGLAGLLRQSGVTTALITDAPRIAGHPLAEEFEQQIFVEPERRLKSAARVEQTHLARLLSRAVQWLSRAASPFLLWVHAQAMSGPWDAPLGLRRQLADEDDPVPPDFVEVPARFLSSDHDPDELLGTVFAYAGQVLALDQCLNAFVDALEFLPRSDKSLLWLTSSRGFPLGEHRQVGGVEAPLYQELLHVPCMVRLPDRLGANLRSQSLWQPHHIHGILAEWFAGGGNAASLPIPNLQGGSGAQCSSLVQRAGVVSSGELAFRTPAWFLRVPHAVAERAPDSPPQRGQTQPGVGDELAWELFVKPDDRWDVNNVATRCPDVARKMYEQWLLFQQAARDGQLDQMPRLPDDLIERWE